MVGDLSVIVAKLLRTFILEAHDMQSETAVSLICTNDIKLYNFATFLRL